MTVSTEVRDAVLIVTIDRPAERNAIDARTAAGLAAAFDRLDADPQLRAGILTGAGGTFSAGMDLKAFLAGGSPVVAGRGFGGLTEAPPATPLIAAVEGYALAGGFELVLACDLVVAATDAWFGLPEVQRGLVAAAGGLLRLPQRIPYQAAMKLILTGDRLSAPEADRLGLLAGLVPPGQALAAALELAGRIAANAPLATRVSKQVVSGDLAGAWERQAGLVAPIGRSDDAREGARAFTEKRPPVWTGH